MNKVDLIATVFITAALAGAGLGWRYHQWQRRMRRVQGVVVDQVESSVSTLGTFYYAVVEFIDAGGERIRFTDRFGHGGHPLFPVGSAVAVDYALSDPGAARIHSVAFSRSLALGAVILGVALLAIGIWPR